MTYTPPYFRISHYPTITLSFNLFRLYPLPLRHPYALFPLPLLVSLHGVTIVNTSIPFALACFTPFYTHPT